LARHVDDLIVRGFYERDQEIAARFAQETGLLRFDDAEELLRTYPDLVIIEGLDTEVPALATAAAPYARALLIEKPGAPNRTAMDQLVEQLGRHNIEVEVGYHLHYSDGLELCQEILGSGALGQVTLARFHAGCPIGCGDELWQSIPGDLGGVTYTDGCHMVELILSTLGKPHSVRGAIKRLSGGTTVTSDVVKRDLFAGLGGTAEVRVGDLMYEDVGAAILFYPNKIATFDVTAWEATDWVEDWRMEYYGTNGTLTVTPTPPKSRMFLRNSRAGYRAGETTFSGSGGPRGPEVSLVPDADYQRQLTSLVERLRRDQPASQRSLRTAQAVVHVLDAIYRSSQEDRELLVEECDSPQG
jgi:predicted dehydrogenase